MEVSGPLSQAAAPATVLLEQQLYTEGVAQIRAGNLKDSEKQMQIKKLTHKVMLNLMKSEVSAPMLVPTTESIQKFGKIVGELPLALVFRVMSFIERLSLNDANGIRHKFTPVKPDFNPITSSQFLVLVRECLTKREKTKLNKLLALFVTDPTDPADHEIEQCFDSVIGLGFKSTCLEEIVKAIQETPSKQDIEITAKAIEEELARNGITYKFTKFSEKNYEYELLAIINRYDFQRELITVLDFSNQPIKVVPNILGEFTNLLRLYLNYCASLTLPPDLSSNQALIQLSLSNCTSLEMLPDLSGNTGLFLLDSQNCTSLKTPPDLSGNQRLTDLCLSGCTSLETLPDLSMLTQLWALDVRGVFPEGSGLNREVEDNQAEAQALIRAIEEYRKKTKRKLEAADPAEAPLVKRGRSDESDSDDFDKDFFSAEEEYNTTSGSKKEKIGCSV